MPDYGNTNEPGVVTNVSSSPGVGTARDAPGDLGIVGQANLGGGAEEGSADANTVYEVSRSSRAVELFGSTSSSLLTVGIIDALREGALPVYAVAPEATSVSGEDQSGISGTSFSFDNAPIREDEDSITVSLDGSSQTVNLVLDDPSNYSPSSGECYVNPIRGTGEVASTPGTSLDLDYEYFDYSSAHTAMFDGAGEDIDFFTPLSENDSVVNDASSVVQSKESDFETALLKAGADSYIDTASSFTHGFDDSRVQLVYGTRFENWSSAVAPYAGLCASLGIDTTPINKRLETNKRLHPTQANDLSEGFRGSLIDNFVTPLDDRAGGVRVADDVTTVSDSNTQESGLKFGFNRVVMDFIIQSVRTAEQPFVGKLNSPPVRSSLQGLIEQRLNRLQQSNAVEGYSVVVESSDVTTAVVEVNVDLADPLRFITNEVNIGE